MGCGASSRRVSDVQSDALPNAPEQNNKVKNERAVEVAREPRAAGQSPAQPQAPRPAPPAAPEVSPKQQPPPQSGKAIASEHPEPRQSPKAVAPPPGLAPKLKLGSPPALGHPQAALLPVGVKEGSLAPLAAPRKRMSEVVEIDQADFKPQSRRGTRTRAQELQRRLEQGGRPGSRGEQETPAQIEERLRRADERRKREQERRMEKAVRESKMIASKREELKALEDKKAEELKRMLQVKDKVAVNNRESTIDVVRIRKTDHHARVHKAMEACKTRPAEARTGSTGELPPIGRCLLAPEFETPCDHNPLPPEHSPLSDTPTPPLTVH